MENENIWQRFRLVEKNNKKLSISKQCKLLSISRNCYYSNTKLKADKDIEIKQVVKSIYIQYPFYVYRKIALTKS